jgi:hypothetical protein
VLAIFGGWRFYKARGGSAIAATVAAEPAPPPLSAEERRKLDKLLKDTDGAGDAA